MMNPFKHFLKASKPSGGNTSTNYNVYLQSIKDNTTVFEPGRGQPNLKYLQYPIDAADQKHYILFDILKRPKVGAVIEGSKTRKLGTERGDDYIQRLYKGANRFYSEEFFNIKTRGQEERQVTSSIALYMPQNVKIGHTVDYGAEDQGIFMGFGAKVKEALTPDGVDAAFWKSVTSQAAANIGRAISLVGFEGLGTAAVQRKFGVAAAPLQEMIFNQLDYRSFSFEFKFTPRSREESNRVREILDTMRFAMLPTKVGNASTIAAYEVPDEFVIRFMHGQQMNPYIDQVGLCACTGIDVTYGGSKFATHGAGDPVSITATMSFRELELIERKRYADLKGIKLENDNITDTGVNLNSLYNDVMP